MWIWICTGKSCSHWPPQIQASYPHSRLKFNYKDTTHLVSCKSKYIMAEKPWSHDCNIIYASCTQMFLVFSCLNKQASKMFHVVTDNSFIKIIVSHIVVHGILTSVWMLQICRLSLWTVLHLLPSITLLLAIYDVAKPVNDCPVVDFARFYLLLSLYTVWLSHRSWSKGHWLTPLQ